MKRLRLTAGPLAAVAVMAAIAAGVLTARADGGDPSREPTRHARALPAPAPIPAPGSCAPHAREGAERKPPSAALLRAFGVLRRERADRDALPAEALKALRERGLEPVDPSSARLLREGPGAGRAWIVPVPNVNVGLVPPFLCHPVAVPPRALPPFAGRTPHPRRPRRALRRGLVRPPRELRHGLVRPLREPLPALPAPPFAPSRRFAPPVLPAPDRFRPGRWPTGPQEGVAVVAIGGAAAGGGGALADLVRGRAPVSVEPCAGPHRDMVGVSGIAPDGVTAAFLTSEDGTAIRVDVADNAYAFVVPRDRRPQQRYVVWSGADGTPHVQPLFVPFFVSGRERCARLPARLARMPRVSPGPESQFPPFLAMPYPPHRAFAVPPRPFRPPAIPAPPRPRPRP